ncbi:MAG: DNA polymerase [Dehalogenimonas sp.]
MLQDWAEQPQVVDCSYVVDPPSNIPPKAELYALDTENDQSGGLGCWSIAYRGADGLVHVWQRYGSMPQFQLKAPVVFHNAKWDLRVMKNNRMKPPSAVLDTMIAAYCLGYGKQDTGDVKGADNMVGGLGLKYLGRRYLGMQMSTWFDVIGEDLEVIADYNAHDSVATLLLWEKFEPNLPQHFWGIDMPLLDVLMAMEDRGIKIDPAKLRDYDAYLTEQLCKFSFPFNINSPIQLKKYIYEDLGIEPWKFTEHKQPSTDAEVLESIDDPLCKQIVEFRKLTKEKDTYVKNYIQGVDPQYRIHPEFKQTSTATGRLSCFNPNLQNVPTDGPMREMFIAKPGHKLVVMDASQLEYRVFAALSEDEQLIEMYRKGGDIHAWAQNLFGLPSGKEHRRKAKTWNFAVLFGGSPYGLSRDSGMSIDDSTEIFRKYYAAVPGVQKFHEKQKALVNEKREVYNLLGRRRRLDAMYVQDHRIRSAGEREGINTPCQGTGGDVVKTWMIDLHYKHSAPMLVQVHDELIYEIPENDAEEYAHWLNEYIPTIIELNGVKFPVDVGVGNNWKEAKH